jgi:aminopeptidase-like protein
VSSANASVIHADAGRDMHAWMADLYPLCRSITGDGIRETLKRIATRIPLDLHEVASGTQVFDWTVPLEWNIRDAYIKNVRGERVVDFQRSNLHVVSYSVPVKRRMQLQDLRPHLFTLPDHPDRIPYRTSYYKEAWGFCVSNRQMESMRDEEYDVCIDSSLNPGHLTYGECYLPGETNEEVLISTHVCHPSLCNDNLSGIVVATFLARALAARPRRLSYRFVFIPGTIGAITWLALNECHVGRIKHGLVLTGVGDGGAVTYKKSRRGDADIDKTMAYVLKRASTDHRVIDFFPYGYDERQYCSPGFNLAVGCFMRSQHSTYSEYHTSADNLDFVKADALAESLQLCLSGLDILDNNRTYVNQHPKCEPQLGRRGLYQMIGGQQGEKQRELALLWVLNLADGRQSLLDMALRSGVDFDLLKDAAEALTQHGLLRERTMEERVPGLVSPTREHA